MPLYEIELAQVCFGSVRVVDFRLYRKFRGVGYKANDRILFTYECRETVQVKITEVLIDELGAKVLFVACASAAAERRLIHFC